MNFLEWKPVETLQQKQTREDFSTLGPRFRELLRVGGGRAPGNAIQAGLGWCWVDVGLMVDVHS